MTQKAIDYQIGGSHYTDMAIQPSRLWVSYDMRGFESCISKYVSRYDGKGGLMDLSKGVHYCDYILDDLAAGNFEGRPLPAWRPPLSVTAYIEANAIEGHAAAALIALCAWCISWERDHIISTRKAVVDLIREQQERARR